MILLVLGGALTLQWMPIGSKNGVLLNLFVVGVLLGSLFGLLHLYQAFYVKILEWCLAHKKAVLTVPIALVAVGILIWAHLGKEFMPALDEGSFLWMPSLMSHASLSAGTDLLQKMDARISQIPEVEHIVGKLGRADSALDPAPITMIEAIITYKPQSQWRSQIHSADDIFAEIQKAAEIPDLIRSEKRFAVIIPLALATIFLILMVQFRSIVHSLMVFSSIFVAWSGGFILLWLFGQDWFLALPIVGNELRDVFHISPVYLSVAVWVGFLALFGVASNDAVLMTTYLNDVFKSHSPKTVADIRKNVILGAARRVRPCLMTAATAIIALLPILTSNGKGADIMRPMALPTLGGMTLIVLVSLFVTPVLYCVWEEYQLKE